MVTGYCIPYIFIDIAVPSAAYNLDQIPIVEDSQIILGGSGR